MGIGVGLNSYWGLGEESAWGTSQTPDRFFPIAEESVDLNKNTIEPKTMIPGKFAKLGDRRVITKQWGAGDATIDVTTTGMGRLFKHALGDPGSGPTQVGTSAAYLQTFKVGSLQGKGLTIQKVIRDSASNVLTPLTLLGGKINKIGFKNSVDDMLSCTLDLVGKSLVQSVAAATPSYPSAGVYNFMQGAITLGGTPIGTVKSFDMELDNKLKTDRDYIGSNGSMAEPVDNADFKELTGTLSIDFTDTDAAYAAYRDDTALALVITYTGGVIGSGNPYFFKLTAPYIKLDGDTPKIGGPDEINLSCKFDGYVSAGNSSPLLQIDYQSTDMVA